MNAPIQIPLAAATTPELIDRAIEERLAPGLAANRWRPDFADFREKRLWAERHQKVMLRKLEVALGDLRGRRILDLGCGRGGLSVALARAGCQVVAMDLRRRNLETTILRGRRHGIRPASAVAVGERLPFADRSFDLVICKDMLEHCQAPGSILAEIGRVLAPGGACYLTVVNRFPFKDPHYHLWFVNFLPAAVADRYILWRGRGKESFRDHQKLGDMHYYRLPRFRRLARTHGLAVRRDLHGLGRRPGQAPARERLARAMRDAAYRLGKRLSLGVTCFELLVGRDENGRGASPLSVALLALLLAAALAGRAAALELTDLRPGLRVEVKGEMDEGAARFSASRVTLKPDDGRAIEVKAPVSALAAPDAALAFHLLGRPVTVLEAARVKGAASRAELIAAATPGRWVKIRARDEGDLLVAESVSLRPETAGSAEIEGPIDRVKRRGAGRAVLEIGGFEIEVDDSAQFISDADASAAPALVTVPRAVDDDDARPRALRLLDGRLALGGQLRWDLDPESNLDLDRRVAADRTSGTLSGQLEVDARLAPSASAFLKFGLRQVVGLTEPPGIDIDQGDVQLHEMYLLWATPLRWAAVEVGRQDFDEPREWLYDENLDAMRLHLAPHRRAAVELALAGHLGASGPEGERGYGLASVEIRLAGKTRAGAYAIGRNDPVAGDDARWLGLRASGAPVRGLAPWLELGRLRGRNGARRHRGSAVDFGMTLEPLALLGHRSTARPAVTVGFARGSGDADGADGEDRIYRQVPFADNTDRFAGVTSFQYYGELLDPELSNVKILTMGAGFRVLPSTSIDLVYHRYRQVVADNRVRGSIAVQPLGRNPYLGSEADLIVGIRELENLEIELDLSAFLPGRAFAGGAAAATRASLQFKLNF